MIIRKEGQGESGNIELYNDLLFTNKIKQDQGTHMHKRLMSRMWRKDTNGNHITRTS